MTHNNHGVRYGEWADLFKILARGAAITPLSDKRFVTVSTQDVRLKVRLDDIALLAREGYVRRQNDRLCLTFAGENLASATPGVSIRLVSGQDETTFVSRNENESPLNGLLRHKGSDGKPFLTERQFEAGERLRADFTYGQLSPRMSANLQARVSSGRHSGVTGKSEDLTLAAIASRQRFEAALDGLGPDLGGALVDVCCFLKGLEQVEIERRWPKRSAKFMLRAGLTLLALHYNPQTQGKAGRAHHWGTDDYRPLIK